MNPRLLQLYHSLPPWAQSAGATARGWQLRYWRYGPETDALVQKAFEREHWGEHQWREWQSARLSSVLRRAVERVPYYRDYWAARGGLSQDYQSLENWPILEKETVRANPKAFVADDCDIRRMFPEHTSGSTGSPMHLWWSHKTTRSWYALFEARWRRWYGVSRHDKWGILGGQRVVSAGRRRPPFWVWNAALHQLYLSAFHMSRESMPFYLDAIRRHQLRYLWGYTSALYQLACCANDSGLTIPLQVVITNAEPLYEFQRQAIARAFQCPVRETYGMAEIVVAASECEHGSLHLWPEVGVIELMQGTAPVAPGTPGDLVATGLFNLDMPLIRYRTGDRLLLSPPGRHCSCGRLLPIIGSLEGRIDDIIVTIDGRRLGRLDPLFKADLPIREAQVIQRKLGHLEVLYVPANEFTADDLQSLENRFRDYLGPMEFTFLALPEIPRNANGKFRSVISTVKIETKPEGRY